MRAETRMDAPARALKPSRAGVVGWMVVMLLAGGPALADPADKVEPMLLAALPAAISLSIPERPLPAKVVPVEAVPVADPAATNAPHVAPRMAAPEEGAGSTGTALIVAASSDPTLSELTRYEVHWREPTTDEALAAAVALGPSRDLEPKNPFRKRSNDLFRTERNVEIGNKQMLLRVRLRPQSRETMSVELRF
jgi:hypothetical protein